MKTEISVISGKELYVSPEFKALCKKLGIPWEFPTTTTIVITVPHDGSVTIDHQYRGYKNTKVDDPSEQTDYVDRD